VEGSFGAGFLKNRVLLWLRNAVKESGG